MEAWGGLFFLSLFLSLSDFKAKKSELPHSKKGSEYSDYISCATSQQIPTRPCSESPRGRRRRCFNGLLPKPT